MALISYGTFKKMLEDQQLFDVFDNEHNFAMRAPMRTLYRALRLQDEAVDRIVRECNVPAGECAVHFNGKPPHGIDSWNTVYIKRTLASNYA